METPFNRPFVVGKELYYIAQAVLKGHLAGNGFYTKACQRWIEENYQIDKVLLTHSATASLEMAALLTDIRPGDEVILPSYTFVSTANAFALRGGVPVWCDIREDTLNMDETLLESLITKKTKVIVPVHYAGVACEMDSIMKLANQHKLLVVEDAAQAVNAFYKGRALGGIGHLGCFSFHETKNYISGEGGALLINDRRFAERAEIVWEKGTNRSKFFRGEVDKYTWIDIGSSYLPSELVAAFLFAQLEDAESINRRRLDIWERYFDGLAECERKGLLRRPVKVRDLQHNGHMFYLILNSGEERDSLIRYLKENGVHSVFHYVPLHTSPMGLKLSAKAVSLPVTDRVSERLLRLPCYFGLSIEDQSRIIDLVCSFFER